MDTILFEYCGVTYDVPAKWQTYEWWMWYANFDIKEAKKAQKAFRKFIIEMVDDPSIEQARQEMSEIRSLIISETRQYLKDFYNLEDKDHYDYVNRMKFLKSAHNECAMICGGCVI